MITLKSHPPADYSLPVEALVFKPAPSVVVQKFKNGDTERKIYNNVPLQKAELEKIKEFDKFSEDKKLIWPPRLESKIMRYISRTRGKVKPALEKMKGTLEWTEKTLSKPIVDTDIVEDLKLGICYFSGRDRNLRPLLMLIASRIPTEWYTQKDGVDRLLKILIFHMEYLQRYMFIPGRVENINVIVDLDGLSTSQLPVNPLKQIVTILSNHYMGRTYRVIIYKAPGFINMMYTMAKSVILTDR